MMVDSIEGDAVDGVAVDGVVVALDRPLKVLAEKQRRNLERSIMFFLAKRKTKELKWFIYFCGDDLRSRPSLANSSGFKLVDPNLLGFGNGAHSSICAVSFG